MGTYNISVKIDKEIFDLLESRNKEKFPARGDYMRYLLLDKSGNQLLEHSNNEAQNLSIDGETSKKNTTQLLRQISEPLLVLQQQQKRILQAQELMLKEIQRQSPLYTGYQKQMIEMVDHLIELIDVRLVSDDNIRDMQLLLGANRNLIFGKCHEGNEKNVKE